MPVPYESARSQSDSSAFAVASRTASTGRMSALGAPRAKLIVSEAIAFDDSDTCAVKPEPLAVIRRGLELFNEGEYERSIASLPPEIEWDTTEAVPDGGSYPGTDAVLSYWRSIGGRWDDFRIEADR